MLALDKKFAELGAEYAPGQEVRKDPGNVDKFARGTDIDGLPVDFSHGDVDAFPPIPGASLDWHLGFERGGRQAYTEYRGDASIREGLAKRLTTFTGAKIAAERELIITPGTQGALFLALGATVTAGTRVAIVEPDYFANRKLVRFFGGRVVPIPLNYLGNRAQTGLDLDQLEAAFKNGVEVLVFSNPNNPTGHVYSQQAISMIASLAATYGVTVIVDQLYSRLLYDGESFTHLRASKIRPKNLITIMGPSKTESLSGFRLGVAFGTSKLIDRMEQLQAIVSLRAAGYNQAVLDTWFREPREWMLDRIARHQAIRDDLIAVFAEAGLETATSQAGSYLFPKLPKLEVETEIFAGLLRRQASVTVTPGSEFGSTTGGSIRLNFSQDHGAAIAAGQRIVAMIERYRT